MANHTDIERLNYYEGEYLGALDFEAEQDYHREMRRRHNVGPHTWGIVSGLDLAEVPNGQMIGPSPEVDILLQPGMAIDGFGREIVVLARTQLTQELFAAFFDPNPLANARFMYVWIAYQQQFIRPPKDLCTSQSASNPFGRVQETFRLLITTTPVPTPSLNDALIVDGTAVEPPPEPNPPPSPPPTPTPGQIVLPYDGSVPYQEFPEDDSTANWYVPLGRVLWHPYHQVFLNGGSPAGRQYSGAVASVLYASAGKLTIQDRNTPTPLPLNPLYQGVVAEVAGSLTVDRLLTAKQDAWIYESGHLNFKDPSGSDGDTPLWIRRNSQPAGGADLHIHIGDNSDPTNKPQRLTIGFGPVDESTPDQLVMEVRADGNANLPGGSLTIGGGLALDQLNANDGEVAPGLILGLFSGEGIASKRTPTGNQFGLDLFTRFAARLSITNDGRVGIGTQTPLSILDVNGDVRMSGKLTVKGGQNIITAQHFPRVVKNSGQNPAAWSVNYPGIFAEVYVAFAIFQGFSIYDQFGNTAFTNYGNDQGVEYIPQHAFVRVDFSDANSANGFAFCSQSDPTRSTNNCILFTLVVIGKPIA